MTKAPWWAWVVAGLALVGSGYWFCSIRDAKRAAFDAATLEGYKHTIEALQAQSAKLDTVYLRDTLTLTKWRNNWDALAAQWREESAGERDTITLRDTITVERLIATADTTIRACTQALRTCESQQAVLRSLITVDSSTIRALSRDLSRAKIRNRIACAAGPGWSLNGPAYMSVSCGIRLF